LTGCIQAKRIRGEPIVKWVKRIFGALATLLGAVGMIACLIGSLAIWNVRDRMDEVIAETFVRIDVALSRLADGARQTNTFVQDMRDSTHQLNDRVQEKVAELTDEPKEEAAGIDQIERRLYAHLEQVRAWIAFTQATVGLVEQSLEMMESTSAFLQDDSHTTLGLLESLHAGKQEIEKTSALFEELQVSLAEIRVSQNVDENARKFKTLYSSIDSSLAAVHGFGEKFEAALTETRTDITELGSQIRWRLTVVAIVCTFLLLWAAAAQCCLAVCGYNSLGLGRSKPEFSS
jgi:methyl-accepting chemotaxis protein